MCCLRCVLSEAKNFSWRIETRNLTRTIMKLTNTNNDCTMTEQAHIQSPPASNRLIWLAVFLIIASLLAYGYYLQFVKYLDPCPLCITQRFFYYGIAISALIGAFTIRSWAVQRIVGLLAAVAAIGGVVTAGRQVWLQHLPADKVPECGPGLQFWLENMPYLRTLELLFKGDGNCAEVNWRFLGLSIAEWSLAWFVIFLVIALRMLFMRKRVRA